MPNELVPFVGGSYPLRRKKADVQRSINLFPTPVESGSGKSRVFLKAVPGLTLFSQSVTPPPGGDPFWANVVLLVQGGIVGDQSRYARPFLKATGTSVTNDYEPVGLPTIKLTSVLFGVKGQMAWSCSAPELQWGDQDFTVEGYFNNPTTNVAQMHFLTDGIGGAATAFNWGPNAASNPGPLICQVAGSTSRPVSQNPPGITWPGSGYFSIERVGDTLIGAVNGVVQTTTSALTPGFTFPLMTVSHQLIGMDDAETNNWFLSMDCVRTTMGVARYGGMSYPVPTTLHPTSGS